MDDNRLTLKNCLQWGLRVVTPEYYFKLLRRHASSLVPNAQSIIRRAHYNLDGGLWWRKWLTCEIRREAKWMNIATGRRIADWHTDRVAVFASWAEYEEFREDLREATSRYFE